MCFPCSYYPANVLKGQGLNNRLERLTFYISKQNNAVVLKNQRNLFSHGYDAFLGLAALSE